MVVPLQTGSESKARMLVGGTIETISRQNVCLYATYDEGLVAGELGWDDQQWHQVVGTFQNANSNAGDARAALYIDGQLRATMAGYQHTLTWDIESLGVGLGQRYVGSIDDLLILDRALSAAAVADLFQSDQPAAVAWA